jgi:hypothetical protein
VNNRPDFPFVIFHFSFVISELKPV